MAYWKPKTALDFSTFLKFWVSIFGYMNYRRKIGWYYFLKITGFHSFILSFIRSFVHSYEKIVAVTDDWLCLCAHELPSSAPLVAFLVDDYHQAHALLLVLLDIDHPRATVIHPGSRVKRLERASEGSLSLIRKPALQERRGRRRGVSVGRACVLLLLRFDADFRVCDVMLISWSIYDF